MEDGSEKKFSNGAYIWAIIQTIAAIFLIIKAQEMYGFEAFFAILVGIGWIILWWWFAKTN